MGFLVRKGIAGLLICAVCVGAPFAAFAQAAPVHTHPISESVESIAEALEPVVSSPSAVLINADAGEILYEKNADARREPGVFAKVLTALLAIETLESDDVLTMDGEVYNVMGDQIFLQTGERITAGDLMYATLLCAADDATVALAKGVSGSVLDFVGLMNEKARAFGCTGTTFVDPRGLATEGQESTVRDLARIVQAAMGDERFRSYISKDEYTIPATNAYNERVLENMGILQTGGCVTEMASRGGNTLVAAVFVEEDDAGDGEAEGIIARSEADMLLEYGFAVIAAAAEAAMEVSVTEEAKPVVEETPARRSFFELIGSGPESLSFYIKIGAAVIVLLVIVLLIVLIRHRYTRNPYVRNVRYGRVSREIRRVRGIR